MQPARVGAFVIHRAAACFGIQVLAVAAGATRQGEDAVLEIEVINQPRFGQALGNLLGLFVFGFKWVDQLKTYQVGQLDFDGHGAAVGRAVVAQPAAIAGPGVAVVDVDDGDVRSHACTDERGKGGS